MMYSGLKRFMKEPYYNLPRRCGKTPDYIRYYQHAFLLDDPKDYDAVYAMIMNNISSISTLHKKYGEKIFKNISPLTLRKYCLREKAAHEKTIALI
ncbi:MAG: hypothetical protein PUD93_04470 [Lachnospiraceae bacterium]|nr:hypothetical protein [Lachnospiraceae bacterium]